LETELLWVELLKQLKVKMLCKFDDLQNGDFFFFTKKEESNMLLYQKITSKCGYNTVLLNTGELCNIYTEGQFYQKAEVSFDIKPIN
jgi:hypothetical protein